MDRRPEGDFKYGCHLCTFITNAGNILNTHIEDNHTRELYNWCKWCGKAMDGISTLVEHLTTGTCHETYHHPCGFEDCGFTDPHPAPFIAHLKALHKNKQVNPCAYCRRPFTFPTHLVMHLQNECCNRPKTLPQVKATPKPVLQTSSVPANRTQDSCPSTSTSTPKIKETKKGIKLTKVSNLSPNFRTNLLKNPFQNSDESEPDDPSYNPSVKNKRFGSISDSSSSSVATSSIAMTTPKSELKRKRGGPGKTKSKKIKPDSANLEEKDTTKPKNFVFQNWSDWFDKINESKSADAIGNLLQSVKIQDFFKCMEKTCYFSTNDEMAFTLHITKEHSGKPLKCLYCFSEFVYCEKLIKHMRQYHNQRRYQCSSCLFRGCSKKHVRWHQQKNHVGEDATVISCKRQEGSASVKSEEQDDKEAENRNLYGCFVPSCDYSTLITEDFCNHLTEQHPTSTFFSCCYCKFETVQLKELLSHFGQHDIHEFECRYCLYGSSNKEDVEQHMCINHGDNKLMYLSRYVAPNEDKTTSPKKAQSELGSCKTPSPNKKLMLNDLVSGSSYSKTEVDSSDAEASSEVKGIDVKPTILEDELDMRGHQEDKKGLGSALESPTKRTRSSKESSEPGSAEATKNASEKRPGRKPLGERSLVCKFCDKTYSSFSEPFKIHMEKEHGLKDFFQCSLCNFEASNSLKVKNHAKSAHPNLSMEVINRAYKMRTSESYVCVFCNTEVGSETEMTKHLYFDFEYFKYRCGHCDYKCLSVSLFDEHNSRSHTDVKPKPTVKTDTNENLESWVANYIEAQKSDLEKNMVPLKLNENGVENQCRMCSEQCSSPEKLKEHLYQHLHYTPHHCQLCDKKSSTLVSIVNHSSSKHLTNARNKQISYEPLELVESWVNKLVSFKSERIKSTSINCLTVLTDKPVVNSAKAELGYQTNELHARSGNSKIGRFPELDSNESSPNLIQPRIRRFPKLESDLGNEPSHNNILEKSPIPTKRTRSNTKRFSELGSQPNHNKETEESPTPTKTTLSTIRRFLDPDSKGEIPSPSELKLNNQSMDKVITSPVKSFDLANTTPVYKMRNSPMANCDTTSGNLDVESGRPVFLKSTDQINSSALNESSNFTELTFGSKQNARKSFPLNKVHSKEKSPFNDTISHHTKPKVIKATARKSTSKPAQMHLKARNLEPSESAVSDYEKLPHQELFPNIYMHFENVKQLFPRVCIKLKKGQTE